MIIKKIYFLLVFCIIYTQSYSQNVDDYKIYSIPLESQIELKDNFNNCFIVTNTLSDFALSRLDENFDYDINYVFNKDKFELDTVRFNMNRFYSVDRSILIEKEMLDSILNSLYQNLKLEIVNNTNLQSKFFDTNYCVKVIKSKKIDNLFLGGRLKKNKHFLYDGYFEFSKVVYSKDKCMAMFYYTSCRNCYNVDSSFGGIVVLKKDNNNWAILGESKVYSKYD